MKGLALGDVPLPLRWGLNAAAAAALLGGLVGLVVGLAANPATAWFAVFELGVPSAILGGLLGFSFGAIRTFAAQRRKPGRATADR